MSGAPRVPSRPAAVHAGRSAWWLPAAVLAAAAALALISPGRLNHDCALYLQCGQALLEGQRPYVDFVDLNPPFIFYLSAVPVLLARWLWAPLPLTFTLGVLALAAWSTYAIRSSLARDPRWAPLATPVATLWAAYSFLLRMSNDFGQREHLLLLLLVPHVVARGLGAAAGDGAPRRGPRIPWRALAAGLAICIKPQYVLVAAAVELWTWFRAREVRRPWDAEAIALWAPPALYALHFALLPAEVRAAFFGRWLPLVAARYSVYDESLAELFHVPTLLAAAAGLVAIVLAWRHERGRGDLAGTLGVFVASAAAVYFLQHKGWPYHRMPIASASAVLLALWVGRAAGTRAPRLAATAAFGAGLAWAMVSSRLPLALADAPGLAHPLTPLVESLTQRDDPVLVVGSGVYPAYPLLLETHRRPGSRYLWFFPVPMLASEARALHARPDSRPASVRGSRAWLDAEEERFLRDLDEDLTKRAPPLVLVAITRGEQGCPPDFTVFAYLERHGLIARIAEGRLRLPDAEGFAVFANAEVVRRPR